MNCCKTLIRRSRRDELLFLVRCINNIIKPWNELWTLGKGSKDYLLQLKLMREISPVVTTTRLLMTA